jgi:hypothetical protein
MIYKSINMRTINLFHLASLWLVVTIGGCVSKKSDNNSFLIQQSKAVSSLQISRFFNESTSLYYENMSDLGSQLATLRAIDSLENLINQAAKDFEKSIEISPNFNPKEKQQIIEELNKSVVTFFEENHFSGMLYFKILNNLNEGDQSIKNYLLGDKYYKYASFYKNLAVVLNLLSAN